MFADRGRSCAPVAPELLEQRSQPFSDRVGGPDLRVEPHSPRVAAPVIELGVLVAPEPLVIASQATNHLGAKRA